MKTEINKDALIEAANVLWTARLWHSGDKWRFSDDPNEVKAWEIQRDKLLKAETMLNVLIKDTL